MAVQHDLWYNISAAKGSGVESTKYVILLRISVSFKNGTGLLKSCQLELCSILNSILNGRFGLLITVFFFVMGRSAVNQSEQGIETQMSVFPLLFLLL